MNNVFINEAKIESQTIFKTNGNVKIYPIFNLENELISGTGKVSLKGTMTVEQDAVVSFVPFKSTGTARRSSLFDTKSGGLKENKSQQILELKWKKELSIAQKVEILRNEIDEVITYLLQEQ